MTLVTGSSRSKSSKTPRFGFTLLELILVMALLLIVLGVSAPQLQNFFRGRNLDSEARRFLSLTVYGQSRAITEGVPMLLWVDVRQRTYGLRAASGYMDPDPKALEFALDQNLRMEVPAIVGTPGVQVNISDRIVGNLPTIRFTPDGFISESSPPRVFILQGDRDIIAAVESTNRLRYELQAINSATAWR
jgi:prepilin-type N-terminal cleavage/methylation domain-containing protein